MRKLLILDLLEKFDQNRHTQITYPLDGTAHLNFCSDQLFTIVLWTYLQLDASWLKCYLEDLYFQVKMKQINCSKYFQFLDRRVSKTGQKVINKQPKWDISFQLSLQHLSANWFLMHQMKSLTWSQKCWQSTRITDSQLSNALSMSFSEDLAQNHFEKLNLSLETVEGFKMQPMNSFFQNDFDHEKWDRWLKSLRLLRVLWIQESPLKWDLIKSSQF